MKNAFIFAIAAILLVRCGESAPQTDTQQSTEIATENNHQAFTITDETLKSYALSPLDSVYSVAVKFTAKDSTIVNYKATLKQGETIYEDSLVVTVPAGETVQGELIFSACRVKNQQIPELTSKASAIGN